MNKLRVTWTLIGFFIFTACKKYETVVQETTLHPVDSIQESVDEINEVESNLQSASKIAADIPQFSNEELQEFAQGYGNYFEEIVEADRERDNEKLQELTLEGMEWSKKASEWNQKMSEEDALKWANWSSRLRLSVSSE